MDNTRNPISRQFEIAVWSSLAATGKRLQRQNLVGQGITGRNIARRKFAGLPNLDFKLRIRMMRRSEIRGTLLYVVSGLWIGLLAGILVVWVVFP